ncbi:enoyl-CoA hydratase/isomerase family protein [Orrella daihaiensis]|uniref:Enoyl-CoA hydratase/isomerase family protein n=1 Tax=Orrella daihaiensis TaxID=2782176 RepID=A0ABY4AIL7_9BURK|nr:enoyl-CoA hydratase/isomerase family protein [Orrella daihaiensis]UOD49928.1 enoyl-CoA hydratase/isomerase family protein [Orrella daihaiensis]
MAQAHPTDGMPQLTLDGPVAIIEFCRPTVANRLSPNDLEVLNAHIQTVDQNPEILVLLLKAQGKYFCSGYDIGALGQSSAPSSLYFGQTVDRLEQARPVTVAMIQGGIYGGGTDLALACDFRIGSFDCNMFMPATRLGLHFYPGGLRRYVTRLGIDQAKRLFLTAEKIDASEMLRIGFLTDLVPATELGIKTQALLETLTQMAPIPLLGVKSHLNQIANNDMDFQAIEALVRQSERSEDLLEGARAFKERRPPKFSGR